MDKIGWKIQKGVCHLFDPSKFNSLGVGRGSWVVEEDEPIINRVEGGRK